MNIRFRKKLIAILLPPAVALSFAGPAIAADPPKAGTTAQPAQSRAATQPYRDMRASKLIGSDVRNAQNENLGEIKDLIIDVNNDRVYYAILSFGGFLGLGDKLFAYPVSAFTQTGNDDKVILNVDKARLKGAPGFAARDFPDFNAPKYRTDVDGYFGPTAAVKPMPNQMLRRASEWIGKDINDRNGKDVGEIEDLVVNMGNGKIHYAVVEFDKSWSLNDKLLAVPMKALHHTTTSKDLVWDIDKSRVDTSLAFDKNRWPNLNDPKHLVDVDRYLLVLVPTAGAAPGMAGTTTAPASASLFDRLDTNRDGMLSTAEAQKDAKVQAAWKNLNPRSDGSVSRAEFMASPDVMRMMR